MFFQFNHFSRCESRRFAVKIMRQLGEGTFGRVIECWDRRRGQYVAVKIIRAVEKYQDAAMIELQVLTTLAVNDPCETQPIVRLLEWCLNISQDEDMPEDQENDPPEH